MSALHLSLQLFGEEPLGCGGAQENTSSAAHPAWLCSASHAWPQGSHRSDSRKPKRSFSSYVHLYDLKSKVSHNPKDGDFLVDLFSSSISQWKQLLQSSTGQERTSPEAGRKRFLSAREQEGIAALPVR